MIEDPQSFIVATQCHQAAYQYGFRLERGIERGWAAFQSTTAQGTLWLAASGSDGPWFMALDHAGIVAELGREPSRVEGPGSARYEFASLSDLVACLPRIYQLGRSLPDSPLQRYQQEIATLPQATEVERLRVERIGQNIFRDSLLEYWDHRCPLTGITDSDLLRASHIVPWKRCASDADRLDVHNGLLLSALWDAGFDKGLVTFNEDGTPSFSPTLSLEARKCLHWQKPLSLTSHHSARLAWHREHLFKK